WRSPQGVSLVAIRGVQLVTLLLAVAIAIRPTGVTGQLGALFLATIGVFCLALPYRFATMWRSVPAVASVLFWFPMLSTLVVGGEPWAFFASFPRPRVPAAKLLLLCSPLVAVIAWQAAFLYALVYEHGDLGSIPNLTSAIVAINVVYVAAGLAALVQSYRMLTDVTERRRIRVVVAGSCIG